MSGVTGRSGSGTGGASEVAVALILEALSADNDAMRVGATAAVSERLGRPAQRDDVGRGDELQFGESLLVLAAEIRRGHIAIPASVRAALSESEADDG